jgi:hypothetical protein
MRLLSSLLEFTESAHILNLVGYISLLPLPHILFLTLFTTFPDRCKLLPFKHSSTQLFNT